MDKNILKSLLSDTQRGELRNVMDLLKKNSVNGDIALKIICCCCTACLDAKNQFSVEELLNVLKICLKALGDLNNCSLTNYLRSVYHIVKYLIEHGHVKSIISMECMLLRINNLEVESDKEVFRAVCILIYNKISQLTLKRDKVPSEDFLNLCMLSLKMFYKVTPMDVLIQGKIHSYFSCYTYFGVDGYSQYKSYLYVLTLLQEKRNEIAWTEELYKSIIKLLIIISRSLLSANYLSKTKEVISTTINTLNSNFINEISESVLLILNSIMIILAEEESYPESNELVEIFSACCNMLKINLERETNRITPAIESTCLFLYNVLLSTIKTYKTFSNKFWVRSMNAHVQISLYKLIECIGNLLCEVETQCSCKKCNCKHDLQSSIDCSLLTISIFSDYLATKLEITEELLMELKKHLEHCYNLITKLKNLSCNRWAVTWKTTGCMIHNINVGLYKAQIKQCTEIAKSFIAKVIELEGTKKSVIKENILNSNLLCLTEAYMVHKDYRNALISAALNMYLHPKCRERAFVQWARAKALSKDSSNEIDALLQELNLITVFLKDETFLKSICPDFRFDNKSKQEWLLFELQQYKAIWASKVSLNAVCKEIFLCTDVVIAGKAFIQAWGDVSSVHKDAHGLLNDILLGYEEHVLKNNNSSDETNIYLAYLYFIKYNLLTINIRTDNLDDMQKTMNVTKQNNEPAYGIQANPNDECDIVSSYDCLRLDRHNRVLKYLHKSLHTFDKCVNSETTEILKRMHIYDVLFKIAFEYRLHCYTLEYLQAWFLCLKIARLLTDKFQSIESVGYIIEKANVYSESTKELMKEVEEEIKKAVDAADTTVQEWEILTSYYINKSLAYLFNGDINVSLEVYRNAWNAYQRCLPRAGDALKIRLDYLHWQHLLLPCDLGIETHYEESLAKPVLILHSIKECFVRDSPSNFLAILFETYQAVVNMYMWLRLPRDTRCYGREILLIAQEMVIPLRTVTLLKVLAQADILSCRYNDCQVKLDGISEILGLSKQKRAGLIVEVECAKTKVHDTAGTLPNEVQEMMLDLPLTAHQYQASSGSPVLLTEQFKLPAFTNHDCDCICFHCMSVDYQELILAAIDLRGQLSAHQSNLTVSREYYNGALEIYDHLVSREANFKLKVFDVIHCDILLTLKYVFIQTYGTILLNIGTNLLGTSKFSQTNKKLLNLLEDRKYTNMHLYNEALVQILHHLPYPNKKSPQMSTLSPMRDGNLERSPSVTPENRCSKVKLPLTVSPQPRRPKNFLRSIKFDLSDEDESTKATKKTSPIQGLKFSGFLKPKTPAKTPIPSTVKVYTPAIGKIRKKKLDLNKAFIYDDSNENEAPTKPSTSSMGATPASSNTNSTSELTMKMRTKLLTEKLKKSGITVTPLGEIPNIIVTDDNNEYKTVDETRVDKSSIEGKNSLELVSALGRRRLRSANAKLDEGVLNSDDSTSKDTIRRRLRSNK